MKEIAPEVMRAYIAETAQELQDLQLLGLLYLRAKTLRNMNVFTSKRSRKGGTNGYD